MHEADNETSMLLADRIHIHAGPSSCLFSYLYTRLECGFSIRVTKRVSREQRLLALAARFVPCSWAILILLFTMANGLFLAGMAMAAAIALGMGLTLAGWGVACILLRHQVALRLPDGGRATRWLALAGPVFVAGIGTILLAAHLIAQVSL